MFNSMRNAMFGLLAILAVEDGAQRLGADDSVLDPKRSPASAEAAAPGADSKTTTPRVRIANAGFESRTRSTWSVHVYGAQSQIEADASIVREGKQSLRISSTEPSDTALGQELMLRAGHWYRFRGWVRTRGLAPQSASVCGTFQIQMPGGAGMIASGANHQGNTEWTEVVLDFERAARRPLNSHCRVSQRVWQGDRNSLV